MAFPHLYKLTEGIQHYQSLREQSALVVQSDVCAQQGTALLHTEIFSHVWEMELSGCLSGSYISLVSAEKRQNRWEKEMK